MHVGKRAGEEKRSDSLSVFRIEVSDETFNQPGGMMFARPCRLRRSASQRGRVD